MYLLALHAFTYMLIQSSYFLKSWGFLRLAKLAQSAVLPQLARLARLAPFDQFLRLAQPVRTFKLSLGELMFIRLAQRDMVTFYSRLLGLPSLSNLPGLSNLPDLPNFPSLSDLPNLTNLPCPPCLPNLPNLLGLPRLPNLPNLPNLFGLPSFPSRDLCLICLPSVTSFFLEAAS